MQLSANSVKLLSGGNVIKQGDQTPLTFELFDEQGNLVELQEATVKVKIANNQIVLLEKTTTINPDNTVSFSLSKDDVLGNGKMRLEFSVTYANSIVEKFPAEGWQEIMITPTLDDLSAGNVAVITIEQFEQRINTAVTEANTATTAANNAANAANQVAQEVGEATTAANTAASNANTAANAANTAATSANDAAAAANASAEEAETAATNATNASDSANTASNAANLASIAASDAADLANTAASNADAATNSATTAAENANTATTAANNAAVNTQAIVDNTKFIEIYNPLTQYKKNNIVSLNGSSFIAKRDTMGNTPIGDASDLNWGLIAQRGVDGTGSVSTVNNIPPDENGNVEITIPDPDLSGYETVTGAQEKADAAEANAIAWGKSYGLGTVSKTLSSVDLDGVAENGLYYASAVANRPITENGYLIVQVLSGVYSSQKYITATTNREFRRINNNGTWSAWEEIIGSDEFTQFQDEVTSHLADDVSHVKYGVATGSANTYAVTLNPAPVAYVEGMAVSIKINVDSTAASTLNVNGLGAKAIKKSNGTDVTNLKANGIYTLRYDGTNFILQGEGGSGNATASDLLSGKTASTDAGDITGIMPNNTGDYANGITNTVGTRALGGSALYAQIPEGAYLTKATANGGVFHEIRVADNDFRPDNIKQGVDIFGLTGNLKEEKKLATAVPASFGAYLFANSIGLDLYFDGTYNYYYERTDYAHVYEEVFDGNRTRISSRNINLGAAQYWVRRCGDYLILGLWTGALVITDLNGTIIFKKDSHNNIDYPAIYEPSLGLIISTQSGRADVFNTSFTSLSSNTNGTNYFNIDTEIFRIRKGVYLFYRVSGNSVYYSLLRIPSVGTYQWLTNTVMGANMVYATRKILQLYSASHY